MSGLLRLLQLLTMTVWVGGLIFFAFVLAPTAFHVLPSVREAGLIVGACLKLFDWIAVICGAMFLAVTALIYRGAPMRIRGRYELQFLLALVMTLGTGYLATGIIPAMDKDQQLAGGDINSVEPTNPARIHFQTLHVRSERTAGAVLLVGLGVLFLMSRETSRLD